MSGANVRGTGFIPTSSREDSAAKMARLKELGFILHGTILDSGLLFFYTDKGADFAKSVKDESKAIGVTAKDYIDIYVQLHEKEESDGENMGHGT